MIQDDFMLEEYPSILTPQECMECLGIGRTFFYKLVKNGDLPAKRIGTKMWRVSKADLIAYMRDN